MDRLKAFRATRNYTGKEVAEKIVFLLLVFIVAFPLIINSQIMDNNSIIADGAKLELLGNGFSFTEGPASDNDGNVYFTDQPNNQIVKWSEESGGLTVFMKDAGRSNGMFFDNEGNLFTCADMENELWKIGMDGSVSVLVDDFDGKRLNGPNDLWIHPGGAIYFTDPLYKREYWNRDPEMQQDGEHVYYISENRSRYIRVEEDLVKPNGIIGTPDGEKLYVADIGDNKTYVYNINQDGSLSDRKLFAELGSDGMTIDNKGNIYLTGNGVTVFDMNGEKIAHIPVDRRWTANVCFGGKNRDILFITAMDSVFGLRMKVKGVY